MWPRIRRSWLVGIPLALATGYLALCLTFDMQEWDGAFPPEAGAETSHWPAGFLWGVATSAHQVDGGDTTSDWTRFEAEPGRIRGGSRSGRASGHWERVAEDVALTAGLGANASRFSVEWSRVEPRDGAWDEGAWAHYKDEVRRLRAAGVIPMATLLHFTLPSWLAARGGLTASDFPARFGRFAAEAARRLGHEVNLWCTVNEPNVQMYEGYVEGVWPPGLKDHAAAALAFAGLVRGHAAAAAAVRSQDSTASVGAAINVIVFDPVSKWLLTDWLVARIAGNGFNWAFYNSIAAGRIRLSLPGFPHIDEPLPGLAGSADWVGLNYYRRNLVRLSPGAPGLVELRPGPGPRTDTGIEIYPEGLLRLLRQAWRRYRLPIYVTENGIADSSGTRRSDFIRLHAHAVRLALDAGIPIRGYFYWSLLDNFEWAEGFGPKFGLYHVTPETLDRTRAPGAEEFARLAPRTH